MKILKLWQIKCYVFKKQWLVTYLVANGSTVQGSNHGFKKEIPHSNLKQCHLLNKENILFVNFVMYKTNNVKLIDSWTSKS